MIAALVMLAQLASAQLAPVPQESKPIETNVAAIRANPKKFDGQVVRLHGWVNSCEPMSCLVNERASNASGGPGASLSIGADKKFDDTIRPLLPTYVEFDARLNASCLTASACPAGAGALTIVTLRGVVSPEPPSFEN